MEDDETMGDLFDPSSWIDWGDLGGDASSALSWLESAASRVSKTAAAVSTGAAKTQAAAFAASIPTSVLIGGAVVATGAVLYFTSRNRS